MIEGLPPKSLISKKALQLSIPFISQNDVAFSGTLPPSQNKIQTQTPAQKIQSTPTQIKYNPNVTPIQSSVRPSYTPQLSGQPQPLPTQQIIAQQYQQQQHWVSFYFILFDLIYLFFYLFLIHINSI